MRILIAAVALTLAPLTLAACTPAADDTAAKAGAPAAAAEGQTPEAFVRGLYADGYDIEPGKGLWSARTDALLAETEDLTEEGDIGYFEADPICDCQDDGGMRLISATPGAVTGDRADVTVVLTWTLVEPPETRTQTYKLVKEGGAWKIDDIVRDQATEFPQPPLVEDVTRWIAEARADAAQ